MTLLRGFLLWIHRLLFLSIYVRVIFKGQEASQRMWTINWCLALIFIVVNQCCSYWDLNKRQEKENTGKSLLVRCLAVIFKSMIKLCVCYNCMGARRCKRNCPETNCSKISLVCPIKTIEIYFPSLKHGNETRKSTRIPILHWFIRLSWFSRRSLNWFHYDW